MIAALDNAPFYDHSIRRVEERDGRGDTAGPSEAVQSK